MPTIARWNEVSMGSQWPLLARTSSNLVTLRLPRSLPELSFRMFGWGAKEEPDLDGIRKLNRPNHL